MKISLAEQVATKLKSLFQGFKTTLTQDKSASLAASEIDSLNHIMQELDALPVDQAKYLAAYAFILFRAAYADGVVAPDEIQSIEENLKKWGGLSAAQALLITRIAWAQNKLFGSTDNFIVTREFKTMATHLQKRQLLHALFAVTASDDNITSSENDTIRLISNELGLSHEEFIFVRKDFLDKLAALK